MEDIVKRRTLICVAATLNLAIAGAGCSSARGDERAGGNAANGSGEATKIAGCLSSTSDGRFALTAAPDAAVSTAARAMDDERNTYSYVLVGGNDLQSHVGKRVEVTGTLSGKKQDMERNDTVKTEGTSAVGGKETPTVKTKEEIDLEVRQLTVRDVRDLAPTCAVNP